MRTWTCFSFLRIPHPAIRALAVDLPEEAPPQPPALLDRIVDIHVPRTFRFSSAWLSRFLAHPRDENVPIPPRCASPSRAAGPPLLKADGDLVTFYLFSRPSSSEYPR